MPTNPWKHLSPQEAQKRIQVLEVIKYLEDIDFSTLSYLSGEEVLELHKVVSQIAYHFFNEDFRTNRISNPEVIVGETHIGPKSDIHSGTIESRTRPAGPGGIYFSPSAKNFFLAWYGSLERLQRDLKSSNYGSFDSYIESLRVLVEAAGSNSLDLSAIPFIKVKQRNLATGAATPAISSSIISELRKSEKINRKLGYWLRKQPPRPKARRNSRGKRNKNTFSP